MINQINGLFPGTLYPNTTVGGCIDIFENVWPNPEETIELIEESCLEPNSGINWNRAETVDSGKNQKHRTNFSFCLTDAAKYYDNLLAQGIHNQMYLLLLASTTPYAEKHHIPYLSHENYHVLKYQDGQEYKAHADGGTDLGRAISAILYLNDDYEGGEIEFPNFNVKIKPQRGMLILFPSTYPYVHIAHPVTQGTKYAIVTWIKDRDL